MVNRRNEKRGTYVSPDILNYLLDTQVLTEWAPLSIVRRTSIIEAKFDLKLTETALLKLYRENNVTIRKPHTIPFKSFH